MYSLHTFYYWFCSLNAFSPVRITKGVVIKIKLFGEKKNLCCRIAIKEIIYKRRGQAQLDIVNLLFEFHSSVSVRVHSSFLFFSFSFNVRIFWIHGCDRCRFSSFCSSWNVLVVMRCLFSRIRSVCLINKPATQFARQEMRIYGVAVLDWLWD